MALTYVGSAIAGCGDSANRIVTGQVPNGGQVGGLETDFSTSTIVENASNGFQFRLEPLEDSLRAFDQNGQLRFQLGGDNPLLNYPLGADGSSDGHSFVASYGNSEIVILDANGEVATRVGEQERLLYPSDVAFRQQSGELFVADSLNHRVVVYDKEGTHLRSFGTAGEGIGELNAPGSVELALDDTLWVVELGNQRLQRFSPQGQSLQRVGSYGTDPGEFLGLSGLGVDPENGDLYVCDQITGCITIFNSRGEFDFRFRVLGDDGELASVIDISVDEENIYLYLAEGVTVYDDPAFAEELVVS